MPNTTIQLAVALIAAAGAFLVAWIAGGFSLLGLIISKEQQVSGFRQAWIDGLREDIAAFVAHAHQIQSFAVGSQPFNYAEFWKATRDDYIELNQASIRIKLRLNAEESVNKPILKAMGEMEALFDHMRDPESTAGLKRIVDGLEQNAPPLLKGEWVRVKTGEPIYRLAKWLAGSIFVVATIFVVLLLCRILR
jgi:hypothetical protein